VESRICFDIASGACIIHDEKRKIADCVETSGHLDTNAIHKNHIDMILRMNMTPPVETMRRKKKRKKTSAIDVVKSGLQAIDVHPTTNFTAKL
jgi:hypothetical protein